MSLQPYGRPNRQTIKAAIDTLISIMPPPNVGDLKIFTSALGAILERYPDDVVRRFADPLAGIAASSNFFPTLAQCREWLEKQVAPDEWELRRQDRAARAEQARHALPPPVDRSRRPTLKEMGEKYRNDPSPMVRHLAARWRGEEPTGPAPAPGSGFILDANGRAPPHIPPGSIINYKGEIVGHRNPDGTITYLPGGAP